MGPNVVGAHGGGKVGRVLMGLDRADVKWKWCKVAVDSMRCYGREKCLRN